MKNVKRKNEYFCPLWKYLKFNIWIALQLQVKNWHLAGLIAFTGKDFGEFQWKFGLIWPTFWAFEKYKMNNAQYVFSTKLVWMYSSRIPVRITSGIMKQEMKIHRNPQHSVSGKWPIPWAVQGRPLWWGTWELDCWWLDLPGLWRHVGLQGKKGFIMRLQEGQCNVA